MVAAVVLIKNYYSKAASPIQVLSRQTLLSFQYQTRSGAVRVVMSVDSIDASNPYCFIMKKYLSKQIQIKIQK